MRVVIDTNVVMSGIYFGGVPAEVLGRWSEGHFQLALSVEILSEYRDVATRLTTRYGDLGADRILDIITAHALLIDSPPLADPVSRDMDDDKFIACAMASRSEVIVTGDQDLLVLESVGTVRVLQPREFLRELDLETES